MSCLQRIFHLQSKDFRKILKFFVVEGPKIEKMLGYTNLDSEKGFAFFQRFLKEGGILEELEKAGIERAIRFVCTVLTLIITNNRKVVKI